MLTNNEFKIYCSLSQKKFRKQHSKFFVEGWKIVEEGINSDHLCEIIIASKSAFPNAQQLFIKAARQKIRTEIISDNDFLKLSDAKTPQGIAAVFHERDGGKLLLNAPIICLLENVSDPGNVGTIIRSCDWFGVNQIILSGNCAEPYNPKTLRASMGSIFRVAVKVSDNYLDEAAALRRSGYKIIVADINSASIYETKLPPKSVIVFSSESHGPSKEIINAADIICSIPKLGNAESLNVGAAASIILAEFTKK
ncbi:MAG: RNA methyltransferase [Bacteroidetes bacterium]|nr:RNA methyltransferase [Bacteroidota bacterium]